MAAVTGANAPPVDGGQDQQQQGNNFWALAGRMVLIYLAVNMFMKSRSGGEDAQAEEDVAVDIAVASVDTPSTATATAAAIAASATGTAPVTHTSTGVPAKGPSGSLASLIAANAFPPDADLDINLYLVAAPYTRAAAAGFDVPARQSDSVVVSPLSSAALPVDVAELQARHRDHQPLSALPEPSITTDPTAAAAARAAGAAVAHPGAVAGGVRAPSVLLWRARIPYSWDAPPPAPSAATKAAAASTGAGTGVGGGLLATVAPSLANALAAPSEQLSHDVTVPLVLPLSPGARASFPPTEAASDANLEAVSAALAAVGTAAGSHNSSLVAVLTVSPLPPLGRAPGPRGWQGLLGQGAGRWVGAVAHRADGWQETKSVAKRNLLGGDAKGKESSSASSAEDSNDKPAPLKTTSRWERHMDPHLRFRMVLDQSRSSPAALPEEVRGGYRFFFPSPAASAAGAPRYLPPLFRDGFWALKSNRVPFASGSAPPDTTEGDNLAEQQKNSLRANLTVGVSPISMLAWRTQASLEESWKMQSSMGVGVDVEASQEIRRMLLETNPVLLLVTVVVSLLHSLFDMLAFKNDVAFWRSNASQEGLSVRAVMLSAISQLIILLYLFDNDTSWMILGSACIGTAIEFWKVTKASDVSISSSFPFVIVQDKPQHAESETARYDKEAFRYLSMAAVPIIVGCAAYTLAYETHKSWYSWVLGSLVTAVYTFGFVGMCPQLYLNYKLKSVAHLPWRMLTYKALNTVVDDFFAFIIKMPTLHRLACFRDDLVFAVYLYQRWAYRTDYARANEYGVSFAPPGEGDAPQLPPAAAGAAAIAAIAAPAAESEEESHEDAVKRAAAVAAAAAAAGAGDEDSEGGDADADEDEGEGEGEDEEPSAEADEDADGLRQRAGPTVSSGVDELD